MPHPVDDLETLKKELEAREGFYYTKHFKEDVLPEREKISKELVEELLFDFNNYAIWKYEEDGRKHPKYKILVEKSSKYYIKIVFSLEEDKIRLITAHPIKQHRGKPEYLI